MENNAAWMRCALALAATTAMSCTSDGGEHAGAPPQDASPGFVGLASGSRIKVKVWESTDGAQVFKEFFDVDLEVACAASRVRWESAEERCVPVTSEQGFSVRYLDPGCTKPIVVTESCTEAPPPYVTSQYGKLGCPSSELIRTPVATGDPIPVPTEPLYALVQVDNEQPHCDPVAPLTSGSAYSATMLDPSAMVAFARRLEPRTSRLAVSMLETDDGARAPSGLHDLERSAACAPTALRRVYDRTALGCVGSVAYGDLTPGSGYYGYADAQCTQRLVGTMLDCDRPEFGELMGTADPDAPYTCGGADVRFVTVGSEVLHSYAFFRNLDTGICEPSVPGMFEYTHHYFEGDEVSEGTFAIVDPVTVGSGRIRSVYWTSEGTTLYAMGFHDTELDDPCTPYKFKDGSVRCIGTGAFPFLDSSASSTAACSQDLAQRFPLGCAEQGRTPVGFRRPAAGTWCGPQLSEIDGIAASVGPYEEPTVYVGQGQCAEVPRDTPTFRLGADLTPADYVEALSERTL